MSRVALLGGSFNPPHVAHQLVCLWALSTDRADEVWMLPCNEHAFDKRLLPFAQRERMCELASESFPRSKVSVCSMEAELGGKSRTLNTLRALIERYPEHRFSLVIGADILRETDSWYRFDEIEQLVEIIVVGRPGYDSPEGTVELARISATDVRARLADGEDISHLVPARVLEYIERHGLYADG